MTEKNKMLEIFDEIMKNAVSKEAKEWLIKNGFFDSPASTKYHLAYPGGLFEHSTNVTLSLIELTKNNNLKWEREISPLIIGMFHDLCKIDQYVWDDKKNGYVWNDRQPVLGHGDKSVMYIEEYIIKLTEEEKACIRWHMGAFDEKSNWSKYTAAIHEYPNVLYTHMADMISSHILESK